MGVYVYAGTLYAWLSCLRRFCFLLVFLQLDRQPTQRGKKKLLKQAEYRAKYNAKKQASQGRSNAILNLKKEETQGHLKKQR